jgi:Ca2+-binding RTX toxin-like protein
VDAAGDVVSETSTTGGTDTVQSGITYTLGANLENLTLTGTGNIDGTGNTGTNTLTGNAGNNVLDGGAGTDTMLGGDGDDTYVVDATTDVVTESSSTGGTDTIQSSVTYTTGANVENLTLTGTGNINATGNTLDNTLIGNAGNNTLSGGTGSDSMAGGRGNRSRTEQHQLRAWRRGRKPHPDRHRQHQRHRQCAQQRADRQHRCQHPRRRRRR